MLAIPRSALMQSIDIKGVTYTGVMIEPNTKLVKGQYGAVQESVYMLIADKVHTPNYETLKNVLKEGASIEFDGKFHTVTDKEVLYDRLTSVEHHLEVYLT